MAIGWASILSSKTLRAAAVAIAVVAAGNAWLGFRLENLLTESMASPIPALERRIATQPDRARVTMLVFGNSHAMAGLRPPLVEAGLGRAAGSVFNFGLPGSSPFEQLLLAERHLDRFAGAREALINLDECFVVADPAIRLRYATRGRLADRWRYARLATSVDAHVGALVSYWLPGLDFGQALTSGAVERPRVSLQRLFVDVPAQSPSHAARYRAIAYPGGLPPLWEYNTPSNAAAAVPLSDPDAFEPARLAGRVSMLLQEDARATRVAGGLESLEALATLLERRGVRVTLVSAGYHPALRRLLEREAPYRTYRERLEAYLARSGRRLEASPDQPDAGSYYDSDHLNTRGARRFVAWLKGRLAHSSPLGFIRAPERSIDG